eukprot:jgi/Orpsp1_1/1192501/evm.model.d7180000093830.1
MRIINKLLLVTIFTCYFHYSSGNECEITQNIFKELSINIPECCDGQSIICNDNKNEIIELNIDFSNKTVEIKPFPENLKLLTHLEKFNLTGESLRIDGLPNLSSLKNLNSINIKDKYINKFPEGLENLTNLETINISYTRISNITEEIYKLENLKE